MPRLISLALSAALLGCSLAPEVSTFTVSYNGSIEEVNNQLLLANILRASNRAPLYFSDLSQVRGALTVNAAASLTAPFGEGKITTTKHFVGLASAGVATAPTFDVVPLNEQVFTQGIMQPLELQYGKLYWDRTDYPEFLLAMLFVDKIEVRYFDENGSLSMLLNEDGNRRLCYPDKGCPGSEGELDLRTVDGVFNQPENAKDLANFERLIENWGVRPSNPRTQRSLTYHGYTAITPIGADVALGSQGGLKDFAGLDPHKFRATRLPPDGSPQSPKANPRNARRSPTQRGTNSKSEDRYQLYALEDRIIICPPSQFLNFWGFFDIAIVAPQITGNSVDVTPQNAAACDASEWPPEKAKVAPPSQPKKKLMQITIYTRSVEGMIQYLGAVLRASPSASDNPLKFFVHRGSTKNQQVSFDYEDKIYSIGPYREDKSGTLGEDNTMPILALVEQLLNLRKNSKEITTTPAAEIVP